MYGGPVGTNWSLLWRVFAGKGARSVGGMFLDAVMELWGVELVCCDGWLGVSFL